jgi:hypothetical protein
MDCFISYPLPYVNVCHVSFTRLVPKQHTEFALFTGKLVMAVEPADDKTKESSAPSTGSVITFTESATGATN